MSSDTRAVPAVLDDVAEKFPRDVAEHEVVALHESGLYRHLRFKQPKNSHYWFDLITWPGSLVINGDMSTYAFSRIDDMFEFFRGPVINATYWAEKLRADSGTERYSEDKFRALLAEAVAERADEFPDLASAVESDILDAWSGCDYSTEDTARLAIRDFQYWLKPENKYKPGARPDFQFEDTYEWNLTDWDYHFIWCLHAIRWGIEKHDEARAASGAPEGKQP